MKPSRRARLRAACCGVALCLAFSGTAQAWTLDALLTLPIERLLEFTAIKRSAQALSARGAHAA